MVRLVRQWPACGQVAHPQCSRWTRRPLARRLADPAAADVYAGGTVAAAFVRWLPAACSGWSAGCHEGIHFSLCTRPSAVDDGASNWSGNISRRLQKHRLPTRFCLAFLVHCKTLQAIHNVGLSPPETLHFRRKTIPPKKL